MKKSLFATAFLLLFSTLCRAQGVDPIPRCPSLEERFGENVREIVEITTFAEGYVRRDTFKVDRDGSYTSSWDRSIKVETEYDNKTKEWVIKEKDGEMRWKFDTLSHTRVIVREVTIKRRENGIAVSVEECRTNLQMRTDSCFEGFKLFEFGKDVTDSLPLSLNKLTFYNDSNCRVLRKSISFDEERGCFVDSVYSYAVGDTTVTVELYDTSLYCPRPYYHIRREYPHGEEYCYYSRDSTLAKSFRYVYNNRKLLDTVYAYWRHGRPAGCIGPRARGAKECRSVETYQYDFDKNGALVEERKYEDGKLFSTTRYKIKYYRKKRKAKSK